MWEWTVGFGVWTRNPGWAHWQCLVFQTPSEMSILRIRVRYAGLMALLNVFKGTVDTN